MPSDVSYRGDRRIGCTYGGESERMDLNTKSGNVLLLELTSQVALDEGSLYYVC